MLSVLRRNMKPRVRARILDVGCGDGLFFEALGEFGEPEGLEPSADLLNPSGPYRSRIRVAPFDASFQPGKTYDLILMLDVLEHLPDPQGALLHAASLLTAGGALLLTVPAFQALWTNHDVINHHVTRYRRRTLRPLLRGAELEIVEERYWYQWTCPVKLAQKVTEKLLRLQPRLPSIPPAGINAVLYRVSRLEQETFAKWMIPFGSSLMVYSRRGKPG